MCLLCVSSVLNLNLSPLIVFYFTRSLCQKHRLVNIFPDKHIQAVCVVYIRKQLLLRLIHYR